MTDTAQLVRFLDVFPMWLRSLGEDAGALGQLASEGGDDEVKRYVVSGLNYIFKSLDLIPDGIDDIGYLDDAFVLRVSARDALGVEGAKAADLKGTLERLAGDVETIGSFLGGDQARLESYVKTLAKGAARGRTVDDIVSNADVRREFVSDVHAFAKGYAAPSFNRDEKTLVKMKSFLSARLPAS